MAERRLRNNTSRQRGKRKKEYTERITRRKASIFVGKQERMRGGGGKEVRGTGGRETWKKIK